MNLGARPAACSVQFALLVLLAAARFGRPLETLLTSLQASLTHEALGGLSAAAGAIVAILIIRQVMSYTRR